MSVLREVDRAHKRSPRHEPHGRERREAEETSIRTRLQLRRSLAVAPGPRFADEGPGTPLSFVNAYVILWYDERKPLRHPREK